MVVTGICVVGPNKTLDKSVISKVKIKSLTEEEITRTVDIPVVTQGNPGIDSRSVGSAFGRRIWDYVTHAGHISYIRGLIQGPGWYIR